MLFVESGMQRPQFGNVPSPLNHGSCVREPVVPSGEDVDVATKVEIREHVPYLVEHVCGPDPDTWCEVAEPKPDESGAEDVAPVAVSFRNGEGRDDPFAIATGISCAKDPPVSIGKNLLGWGR